MSDFNQKMNLSKNKKEEAGGKDPLVLTNSMESNYPIKISIFPNPARVENQNQRKWKSKKSLKTTGTG
jgi:hypothetical protein